MNRIVTAKVESELKRLEKRYWKYGYTYDNLMEMYNLETPLTDEGALVMLRFTLAHEYREVEYFSTEDIAALWNVSIEEAQRMISEREEDLKKAGGIVDISFTPPKDMMTG